MDDGTFLKNKGIRFSSNSFTLEECKVLQNLLLEKYKIESSLYKIKGKVNQYNIYLSKSARGELIKIVKPFIHPTMLYKIGG